MEERKGDRWIREGDEVETREQRAEEGEIERGIEMEGERTSVARGGRRVASSHS